MILKSMFIYPVKSLGGIAVSQAKMEIRGLEFDRRWMVLDERGKFLTQRNIPEMALIKTEISEEHLILRKEGFGDFRVPLIEEENTPKRKVKVWSDETEAYSVGEEVAQWLSDVLKKKSMLVRMPSDAVRKNTIPFRKEEKRVSFADSQPILIVNETSLSELNSRLRKPIAMDRFRANFIVKAPDAWEEDEWKRFTIGEVDFQITKACGRCMMITIDPKTGMIDDEPFKVLSSYRLFDKNVNFGMRAKLVEKPGALQNMVCAGDKFKLGN